MLKEIKDNSLKNNVVNWKPIWDTEKKFKSEFTLDKREYLRLTLYDSTT